MIFLESQLAHVTVMHPVFLYGMILVGDPILDR
jgi:hypothetical protein